MDPYISIRIYIVPDQQRYNTFKMEQIRNFWSHEADASKTQLERYREKEAPPEIQKFIELGGGQRLGTTCERFARYVFPCMEKRRTGKGQTGYDHLLTIQNMDFHIEQKTSTYWGATEDFKWQHLETDHMWDIALLCGIDYHDVKFWAMNRETFHRLIAEGKITSQGDKEGNSKEGYWFNYSDVADDLTRIETSEDLIAFVSASL